MQVGVAAAGFPVWAGLLGRSPCASAVVACSTPLQGLVPRPSGPWPRGTLPAMGRCRVRADGQPAWLAGPRVPGPLGRPAWAMLAEAGPSALFFF